MNRSFYDVTFFSKTVSAVIDIGTMFSILERLFLKLIQIILGVRHKILIKAARSCQNEAMAMQLIVI